MRESSLISRLLLLANASKPILQWKKRSISNSYFYKTKASIKRLLVILSGDDVCSMLKDVLSSKEKETVFKSTSISEALRNIGTDVQRLQPKKRHPFVRSLKDARLSRKGAKRIGFKPSAFLWYLFFLFSFSYIFVHLFY